MPPKVPLCATYHWYETRADASGTAQLLHFIHFGKTQSTLLCNCDVIQLCLFELWHVAHISQKAVKRKLEEVNGSDDKSPSKWLIKSEPDPRLENGVDVSFSFEALEKEPASTACWDGVRNYSARNYMRAMKVGQKTFFSFFNSVA